MWVKNEKKIYIDMVNIMIVIFEKVYIWGLFFLVFGWLFSRIINNGLDVVGFKLCLYLISEIEIVYYLME